MQRVLTVRWQLFFLPLIYEVVAPRHASTASTTSVEADRPQTALRIASTPIQLQAIEEKHRRGSFNAPIFSTNPKASFPTQSVQVVTRQSPSSLLEFMLIFSYANSWVNRWNCLRKE